MAGFAPVPMAAFFIIFLLNRHKFIDIYLTNKTKYFIIDMFGVMPTFPHYFSEKDGSDYV